MDREGVIHHAFNWVEGEEDHGIGDEKGMVNAETLRLRGTVSSFYMCI
ncbi:hypothetical protein AB1K84_00515 [Mesobacillus foraminis]